MSRKTALRHAVEFQPRATIPTFDEWVDKGEESGMVGSLSIASVKPLDMDLDEIDFGEENKSAKRRCTGEQGNLMVCSMRLITHCVALPKYIAFQRFSSTQ